MSDHTLVTCFIVHVIRDSKLIWTIPESFSRESAEAYVKSFNASEKARTHAERMVIVRQQIRPVLPPEVLESQLENEIPPDVDAS